MPRATTETPRLRGALEAGLGSATGQAAFLLCLQGMIRSPSQACVLLDTPEKPSKAICRGSWCRGASAQKPNKVRLIYSQH